MKSVGIPLILTFTLDEGSQSRLDAWRSSYFPPERNHLKAHLTIYHQLPGQMLRDITGRLEEFVRDKEFAPIDFTELKTRGGFVGVMMEAPALHVLRAGLNEIFSEHLRAQDKQPYKPHVTITNLGSPSVAQKCFDALQGEFKPWQGYASGLELYHYRGGPWELASRHAFALGDGSGLRP